MMQSRQGQNFAKLQLIKNDKKLQNQGEILDFEAFFIAKIGTEWGRSEKLYEINILIKEKGGGFMNREFTFESFILGASNETAVKESKKYLSGEINEEMLLFYGESGNGKTHLALACANALEDAGKKVLCKSAMGLSSEIYNAFFREKKDIYNEVFPKYKKYDALIIDDLRGLSGTEIMQEFFCNLINQYISSEKKVILTLDNKDYESYLEKKLVKLVEKTYALEILEPDHQLLMNILQAKEKAYGVSLSNITKEFMCDQAKSVGELWGLFQRGMLLSQCLGRQLDENLIYAVLEE